MEYHFNYSFKKLYKIFSLPSQQGYLKFYYEQLFKINKLKLLL